MTGKKEITFKELILGFALVVLSYFLIAIFNISNEDLYNWDLEMIFTEGGALNILALIIFGVWYLLVLIWIISIVYRVLKGLSQR